MIKKILFLYIILLAFPAYNTFAQSADSIDVYLLTCEAGTESYSVYGHSAIRVAIRGTKYDYVYNWGIFDFQTPHFALRFAKGNLDYLIGSSTYKSFLGDYFFEGRSVWSQKINLSDGEKRMMISLLEENMKPENRKYRYNFFYDNCATRVRDIIENSLENPIKYNEKKTKESFRDLIDEFQDKMPWLDFGADFLIGLPADKKATYRDQMFLPIYLQKNLSEAYVTHNGKAEKLLGPGETVLDMSGTEKSIVKPWVPITIAWGVFTLILFITFVFGVPILDKFSDWFFFTLFSLVCIILLFFNFFSEHQACHFNTEIIAFNPLIPVIAGYIFMGKQCRKLSKIAISFSVLYFPLALIVGQGIHPVTIPIVFILLVRLYKHCEFGKEEIQKTRKNIKSI